MKSIKVVLFFVLLLSGLSWIISSSCSKDSCKAVTCQNGGVCSGGLCTSCPKGIGGANCEVIYRLLYANTYKGNGMDDSGGVYVNNTLAFIAGTDSNYTKMTMTWSNPGIQSVSFPVTLTNNSSTGSNFTLGATTVGTFTYSGTGSVNNTVASVNIVKSDTSNHTTIISLNNFNKQ